jgi:hypothetical protein
MWPESHLEMLQAARTHLIAARISNPAKLICFRADAQKDRDPP